MSKRLLAAGVVAMLAIFLAAAQEQKNENTMPDMDMSAHRKSGMTATDTHDVSAMNNDGSAHAMHSMEHRHMDMGLHMKMTTLRDLQPGDQEKADQVLNAARSTAENTRTTGPRSLTAIKSFCPICPRSSITSQITGTDSRRECASILSIPHPCCTKRLAMITS
jgi:hypothetical protein